ncbi:tensin-1-like [Diadema antillarum]|uniref:tensin-1-like n=1 Tax=Diadema antillarum TaxID=105358 RepID=UPI003A8878D5
MGECYSLFSKDPERKRAKRQKRKQQKAKQVKAKRQKERASSERKRRPRNNRKQSNKLPPQEAIDPQSHTFKTRVFRNPHSCGVCKEIIWNEGRSCRGCRFACHKRCEYKVMTTCLPPSSPSPGNEKLKQGSPKSPRSPRTSPEGKSGVGSPSENRRRRSPSAPSTPTSPTPPSTPKLQPVPVTKKMMQQQQQQPQQHQQQHLQHQESPKLQQATVTVQHSVANVQHAPTTMNMMQPQVTHTKTIGIKSGDGLVRYSFEIEVDYITERLIAVSFPAGGLENQYRSNLRDVVRMLQNKHQNSYVVFNLSRRRHDIAKLNQEVRDLGWPNVLAPPLERLCSICKQIETWMKTNPNNVVVLHCKGGRGPIGVVVSAFMNYMHITSNTESSMDRFAMKRFLDAKAANSMHPSQRRYIDYFTGLLTNSIQINSAPLFLHHIVIHGVPNYDSNGGCRPFVRIYQGMHPVYTSGVYTVPEGTSRFAITPERALSLRGDILVSTTITCV